VAFPNTSVTAMRFRAPGGDWVRAPNMGFGLSYSLPVVVAGLVAPQRDALLIVENPEAHLHPAGQSRMGTFLATVAATGVQVLVETHSDHVLNGIRRAIGEHGVLPSSDALVHFFDAKEDGEPQNTALRFSSSGGLNEWPKRFFDQYQVDVAALAKVRRGAAR
jgi:predicted ATPase